MLHLSRPFVGEDSLKRARIASFRLPRARRRDVAGIVSIVCLLIWMVQAGHSLGLLRALLWIGIAAGSFSRNRYIRFYEKGLSAPKSAGEVFLTREQLLGMKLEEDRFIVTGPDASWNGPYSSGVFRVRTEDLLRFRDVLTSFVAS
jgi:hypothetical protein